MSWEAYSVVSVAYWACGLNTNANAKPWLFMLIVMIIIAALNAQESMSTVDWLTSQQSEIHTVSVTQFATYLGLLVKLWQVTDEKILLETASAQTS